MRVFWRANGRADLLHTDPGIMCRGGHPAADADGGADTDPQHYAPQNFCRGRANPYHAAHADGYTGANGFADYPPKRDRHRDVECIADFHGNGNADRFRHGNPYGHSYSITDLYREPDAKRDAYADGYSSPEQYTTAPT